MKGKKLECRLYADGIQDQGGRGGRGKQVKGKALGAFRRSDASNLACLHKARPACSRGLLKRPPSPASRAERVELPFALLTSALGEESSSPASFVHCGHHLFRLLAPSSKGGWRHIDKRSMAFSAGPTSPFSRQTGGDGMQRWASNLT